MQLVDKNFEKQISLLREDRRILYQRVKGMEEELAQTSEQLRASRTNVESVSAEKLHVEKAMREVEAELVQVKTEHKMLKKFMAREDDRNAVAVANGRCHEQELEELRLETQELRTSKAVCETVCENSKQECSRLCDENKRLSDELTSLHDRLAFKESEVSKTLEQVMAAKDAAEARLQSAHAENATTLRELAQVSGHCAQLKSAATEANAFADDNRQLREQLERRIGELGQVSGRLESLRESEQMARREEVGLRAELAAYKAHVPDATSNTASWAAASGGAGSNLERIAALERENKMLDFNLESATDEIARKDDEIRALRAELGSCEARWDAQRRRLQNEILELKGNVRVFARVRPFTAADAREDVSRSPLVPQVENQAIHHLDSTAKSGHHEFRFDGVFDQSASHKTVFDEVSPLVQSALDGYNVCVLAYGQTGSGKTHTMYGSRDEEVSRGLVPRSAEQILAAVELKRRSGWEFEVEGSSLEIYNEKVRDLLSKGSSSLEVKHHDKFGTTVPGLEVRPVQSMADVHSILSTSERSRATAATDMNAGSSRSHSVFWLRMRGRHAQQQQEMSGSLFLVDLAGSERLSRSGVTGERMAESVAINKSLSALGDVFQALSKKQQHVPYRNSKLTWLLQPCIGGHGKAMMLLNLSPTATSGAESMCSLRFGALVNQTELGKAKKNVISRVGES